jgi:hypothetical protein
MDDAADTDNPLADYRMIRDELKVICHSLDYLLDNLRDDFR